MAFSLRDYEILGEIGQGGFGTVLKARQKSLGRIVAIKSLSTQRTLQEKEIVRFRREAEAMALISHDNIVSVYDYAYYGNNYYIVMEYIDGIAFDQALTQGIPLQVALLIMEKVISGLRVAHAEKIIHHDIKPSNILLGKQGQVKLADFGLATFQPDVSKYSSTTAILGTFCYMAPEAMVNPREVDARVDIFSLGCILYRILSGKLPFPGTNIGEVSYKVLNVEPEPIMAEESMQELITVTGECLRKNRDERPDLAAVHSRVQDVLTGQYHASTEALKDFISSGVFTTTQAEKTTVRRDIPVRRRIPAPRIMVAGALIACAVCIIAVILLVSLQITKKERLPRLSRAGKSQPLSTSSVPAKNRAVGKIAEKSPKPVSSTSLDASGTLVLKGLSPDDSVIINDTYIAGTIKRGKQRIPLKPDHYTVVVRRANKKDITRKVRVMPYQVFVLEIED